jgi:CHAD domain-containing protein
MAHTSLSQVTLADYSYLSVQKQYIKMLSYEADVFADRDPEALHQMRVSLRRLRTAIKAFDRILDLPPGMSDRQLAKIGKILGKVRDLDVLSIACEEYEVDLPKSEKYYLEELISILHKRRHKAVIKMQSTIESKNYQHLKLSINNWLNEPRYTATGKVNLLEVLPDLILPSIGNLFQYPAWWITPETQPQEDSTLSSVVEELLLSQGTCFHDLRKQVKNTRYLMELFTDAYGERYGDFLQDFKEIQKLLGTIQDTLVFNHLIERMLGKNVSKKMPNFTKKLISERDIAWQSWQPIQHRYQQTSTKQKLRLLVAQIAIEH